MTNAQLHDLRQRIDGAVEALARVRYRIVLAGDAGTITHRAQQRMHMVVRKAEAFIAAAKAVDEESR